MGNLQNGMIDWQDLAFTSDKAEIEKYSLNPGDVLFNRTNSPVLVGKTAIYRGERPALFAGYLIRVNHIETLVNSQYLNLFLGSHVARQYGNTVKTDGVNQSNINGEKLQGYPFPYCSLVEQCEVVRMLDERLSLTDRLMQDIDVELTKSNAMRQSILKKAFSGQLVAQDPNDEPAPLLLERIKAGKAEQNRDNKNKNNRMRDAA
jgi:type I restriction enzyme S subunit